MLKTAEKASDCKCACNFARVAYLTKNTIWNARCCD